MKRTASARKKRKPSLFTKVMIFVFFTLGMCHCTKEIERMVELRAEMKQAEENLQNSLDEQSDLLAEKAKLQDTEYIRMYARGRHMYSKEGEQVFVLVFD